MASSDQFPRASRLRKGYRPDQVQAFLLRVDDDLRSGAPGVSSAPIRRAGFDLVRGGYRVDAVDAHLDDLEVRALGHELDHGTRPTFEAGPAAAAAGALADTLTGPAGARFLRVSRWRRGYHAGEVDRFLDVVELALRGGVAPGVPCLLDAATVRSAVFHARRGGYDETAVDDALDAVVDVVLRRERRVGADPHGCVFSD